MGLVMTPKGALTWAFTNEDWVSIVCFLTPGQDGLLARDGFGGGLKMCVSLSCLVELREAV